MELEYANKLVKTINKIYHKKTNKKINFKKLNIKKIIHQYSNTKEKIYRIFINFEDSDSETLIKRNNPYRIHYFCLECGRENIVNLNNIVRKINRNIKKCNMCKNLDENKRKKQSLYMKNNKRRKNFKNSKNKVKEIISTIQKIKESSKSFELLDDDYKSDYFNKHLTKDEFERYSSKIISFQNDKFNNISNFNYIPIVKIGNQTMYNPYLYDIKRDVLEKPIYIKYLCDSCSSPHICKYLFNFKNKYKLLCKYCSLCNKTFKIRPFKNINKEKITYQSKFELKFIKKCNNEKILIQNGPKLEYIWNNKKLKYIVDFYIPKLNIIIEIKDNHIWHKQQIENGKWGCKIKSVTNCILNNIYKDFLLINKKNYMKQIKKIIKLYNQTNKI